MKKPLKTGARVIDISDMVKTSSDFEEVRILEASNSERPRPQFIFGPCDLTTLEQFDRWTYLPTISVYVCKSIKVNGPWFGVGAILSHKGIYLSCPGIDLDPTLPPALEHVKSLEIAEANRTRREKRIVGSSVLLAANGHQIYGHWLTDFIPKLYSLTLADFDIEKISFLVPKNMKNFGIELLRLLNIPTKNIFAYDPQEEFLIVDELIIPTTLRWGGRASPILSDAVKFLNDRLMSFNTYSSFLNYERLLVTRVNEIEWRKIDNRRELSDIAESKGFLIFHPETLPIIDQIAIFRRAKIIIGENGSGMHNSIFSHKTIRVGCFHHPQPDTFDALQSGIGERLDQITGYIFAETSNYDGNVLANIERDLFLKFLKELTF